MKFSTIHKNHSVPLLNKRLQQLGIAGFSFFLVKGLAWLAIAAWSIYYTSG